MPQPQKKKSQRTALERPDVGYEAVTYGRQAPRATQQPLINAFFWVFQVAFLNSNEVSGGRIVRREAVKLLERHTGVWLADAFGERVRCARLQVFKSTVRAGRTCGFAKRPALSASELSDALLAEARLGEKFIPGTFTGPPAGDAGADCICAVLKVVAHSWPVAI